MEWEKWEKLHKKLGIKDNKGPMTKAQAMAMDMQKKSFNTSADRHTFWLRPVSGCAIDKVIYAWDDDKNLDKEFPIMEFWF